MGGFEYDFERHRAHLRRCRQHTVVDIVDNAVARGKTVDSGVNVAREDFAGFTEGRAQKIFRKRVAPDKAINAVAGIIGVKLDEAAKMAVP